MHLKIIYTFERINTIEIMKQITLLLFMCLPALLVNSQDTNYNSFTDKVNSPTNLSSQNVAAPGIYNVQLNIKVYLEGPYYNGQMTPFLNVLGYLPNDQPYNVDPWNYNGTESVIAIPSFSVVDWVLVDILKQYVVGDQIKFELIGRRAGFLMSNGDLRDIDGISLLTVESEISNGFYTRIHHRNHLSVISAIPLVESGGVYSYDFAFSAEQAMGGSLSQKQLSPTIWGMIAADADASGQINNLDKNEVWLLQENLTGYFAGDFNMDTQVDNDDKVVKWEPNSGKCTYPVKDTILPLFICGTSTVIFNGLEYNTVEFSNKCWLDRNLGATQVATAYNDALSFGDLFQWGRLIDGHQFRNSATTNTLSFSDIPGHADFITVDDDPYDWRSPQNDNLWQEPLIVNNPCPDGWKIPSLTEWQDATTGWNNRADAFNSLLKLPASGWRSESSGNISNDGSWGNYWTTTVNSTGARGIYFDSFNFNSNTYARASGRSVRCLKSNFVPNQPPNMPSDPVPANGETGVQTNINLTWVCTDPEGDDLTYNVYFGTNEIPPLLATNVAVNSYNPGLLDFSTQYYWKIVAYDTYGDSTEGAIWHFTTLPETGWACGNPLLDNRDGQLYNTVQIDQQCWMAENLNIGNLINGSQNQSDNEIIEKYCYDNNSSNCDTYGALYQWNELMEYTTIEGTQGICPVGWHVPSDLEWYDMSHYLDPTVNNPNLQGWQGTDIGTQLLQGGSSGFEALLSGQRAWDGSGFLYLNERSVFFTSTINPYNSLHSWFRNLYAGNPQIYRNGCEKSHGLALRCIKDTLAAPWDCGDPYNDPRDGQLYNTVQIDQQCWMAENMNIGTMISGSQNQSDNGIIEKYCYNDTETSCDIYGGLYQWNELMEYSEIEGSQGICPEGWHVASDLEWYNMSHYLDPTVNNINLQSWQGTDIGTQLLQGGSSGFNALFSGEYWYATGFSYLGERSLFYTSTINPYNTIGSWFRRMDPGNPQIYKNGVNKLAAFGIRCIKDEYGNQPPSSPFTPQPPDGAVNQPINTTLSWSCTDPENDPLTYDVYFGTINPPPIVSSGQTNSDYNPGILTFYTSYFWKIIAHDDHGNFTEGPDWSFITINQPVWGCGDPLIDARDGQAYNTVQIGEQCWMAENLNIGTVILGLNDMSDDGVIEKYCYGNNPTNCDNYGGLYQWNEMMEYNTQQGTQGICPIGWEVPTDSEWCTLTQFIDPTVNCNTSNGWSGTDVGLKMKNTTGWNSGGNGTNVSGFTALPGGYRTHNDNFDNLGYAAYFWSSTESNAELAWRRSLSYNNSSIGRYTYYKDTGFSVRCIKESSPPTWSCGDPLIDTRDSQIYNTVQIDQLCWMAENLDYGTKINGSQNQSNNEISEKYCYDDIESNCEIYGGLYQWNELMNYSNEEMSQGICPEEWHVPSDLEWFNMCNYLDPSVNNINLQNWQGIDIGTQLLEGGSSGFNALLSGQYWFESGYSYLGERSFLYTSTINSYNTTASWFRRLDEGNPQIYKNGVNKLCAFAIRCVKDDIIIQWDCGDPIIDIRDGQSYNTFQVDDQCWMAENLNIGTMIVGSQNQSNNGIIEKYCYDNLSSNCEIFGSLYQWNELMDYNTQQGTQGICPEGWHIPTDLEWFEMSHNIDPSVNNQFLQGWQGTYIGNVLFQENISGFNAILSGQRAWDGSGFLFLPERSVFFTSSLNPSNTNHAWFRILNVGNPQIYKNGGEKTHGLSVRCIKN